MNTNALIATIKSVLHTSSTYNREYCDTVARQLADTLINNWDKATAHYNTSDMFTLAELAAKDYAKLNSK